MHHGSCNGTLHIRQRAVCGSRPQLVHQLRCCPVHEPRIALQAAHKRKRFMSQLLTSKPSDAERTCWDAALASMQIAASASSPHLHTQLVCVWPHIHISEAQPAAGRTGHRDLHAHILQHAVSQAAAQATYVCAIKLEILFGGAQCGQGRLALVAALQDGPAPGVCQACRLHVEAPRREGSPGKCRLGDLCSRAGQHVALLRSPGASKDLHSPTRSAPQASTPAAAST